MSRPTLAWIVLVAFALGGLLTVGEAIASRDLTFPQAPAARVAEFAADPTAMKATGMSFIVSQIALLVGVAALVPLLPRGRGAKTTAAATAVFLLGLASHLVVGGINFGVVALVAQGEMTAAATLAGSLEETALLVPFFAVGLLGFALGFILLGVGFYRARVLPLGVAALFWVSIPLEFALGNLSPLFGLAGRVVFLGALVGLGLALRKSDTQVVPEAAPA